MPKPSKVSSDLRELSPRRRFTSALAELRSRLRISVLANTGAAVLTLVLALWVVPWIPFGMRPDDYSAAVWIALALIVATGCMFLLAHLTRDDTRGESLIELVQSVIYGFTLRNRRQFNRRLARECKAAGQDARARVSLLIVRVLSDATTEPGRAHSTLEQVGRALKESMRSGDIVGRLNDDEVGVIVLGVDGRVLPAIARRLEKALGAALPEETGSGQANGAPLLSIGAAVLHPDQDESALVEAARSDLRPVGAGRLPEAGSRPDDQNTKAA